MKYGGHWNVSESKKILPVQEKFIKLKSPINLEHSTSILDRIETRSAWFTEMQSYCSIPMSDGGYVAAVAVEKSSENTGRSDQLHVLTTNPTCLSTITSNSDKINQILLGKLLNTARINQPKFSIFTDQSGHLLVHEEVTNSLASLDLDNKRAQVFQLASFFEATGEKISHALGTKVSQWKIKGDLIKSHNQVVFYIPNGNEIELLNLNSMNAHYITLPCDIDSIILFSPERWLIQDKSRNIFILEKSSKTCLCPNVLRQVETTYDQRKVLGTINQGNKESLNNKLLSKALGQKIDSPNRLLASDFIYAGIFVGFPDLENSNEVHFWPRKDRIKCENTIVTNDGQVVRILPANKVPNDALLGDSSGFSNYLEIVDVVNQKVRYLPIPS